MRLPDLTTTALRATITITLGGIGASAGFTHTHDWANAHGQHGWLAWADAVVIEGMAVVAGFEIHRDHTTRRSTRRITLPQVVLVAAFLIQMTAQVAQAEPSPAGWLLAAMPALGFLTVVKLTMRRIPADHPTPTRLDMSPKPIDPVGPVETPRPASAVAARLPSAVRQAVIHAAQQAHLNGRPVTAEDIRPVIVLSEPMLTNLITELNTTINDHPANRNNHDHEVTTS